MAGRFAARRGKFGIICWRNIDNEKLFIEREKDTVRDGRGYIFYMTDNEIVNLLQDMKQGIAIDDYFIQKHNEIIE